MKRGVLAAGSLLASVLLMAGCSSPTPVAVDCGGSEVVGTVVNSAGAPLFVATVIAFRQQDTLFVKVDSTYSDANGYFKFTTLDTGTYKLFGQKDSLVAFKNNVKNNQLAPKGQPPVIVNVDQLVLMPPGSISGRVVVDENNMSGVECYIPGTSYGAWTNDSGYFTISNVPADTYKVEYLFAGYVRNVTTPNVVVTSGQNCNIGTVTLLLDPAGAPRAPRGLSASYDTIHGVVTLRWQPVPVADLQGYAVYRKNKGDTAAATQLPGPIVPDTVFVDAVFKDYTDTVTKTYLYYVTTKDNSNNESAFSDSAQVIAVPPSTVRPVIQYLTPFTVVDYTSTVVCSLAVVHLFDTYKVFMDFDGNGTAYTWVEVPHVNGSASDTFFTGNHSAWGPVAVRIVFDGDTIDTSFIVHVRPRPITVITADATDSGVTIRWGQSPDGDFRQYELHRKVTNDTILYRTTNRTDTSFTYKTRSNIAADYSVNVIDTEGVGDTSRPGVVVHASIINTPPKFTTAVGSLHDSAQVNVLYNVMVTATDKNNDPLSYQALSPSGATFASGYFSWTPAIGQFGTPQQCAVVVSDGHGGTDTLSWSVRVVAHGMWVNSDSLTAARRLFGIAEINGNIYAIGGCYDKISSTGGTSPIATKTVEVYDTATHLWSPAAPMANARWAPFVAVWNNKIYVIGGFSDRSYSITAIEMYDPGTNMWTTIGQAPFTRAYGAASVINDKLYCIGGNTYDMNQMSEVTVKSIDVYDLSGGTWSQGPALWYARANMQAQAYNGKIYVFGGVGGGGDSISVLSSDEQVLNTIEVFDPVTNNCVAVTTALRTPRCYFAAAPYGDQVYLFGGFDDNNNLLTDVEIVDLSIMQTSAGVPLPRPGYGAQAIGCNNRFYYIGGAVPGTNGGFVSTRSMLIYYQ